MRKITVFNFLSLNGFYKGPYNDISWHRHGDEENVFSEEMLALEHILLFGRHTYEMMAGYWSSEHALANDPIVAEKMNSAEKWLVSKSIQNPEWYNTQTLQNDFIEDIKLRKSKPGKNITILGSGSIVTQLANAGLIDHFEIMIDPIAIGEGASFLQHLNQPLELQLSHTRVFNSGTVLLSYNVVNPA